MVSLKLSLALAAATLMQFAAARPAARQCTASVMSWIDGGQGGGAFDEHKISVYFNDDPTNILDEQDDKSPKSQLNIYDGKQTLKSDALGGDVLIWAKRSNKAGEADLGSCQVEFMTSGKINGKMTPDSGKRAKTCNVVFNC